MLQHHFIELLLIGRSEDLRAIGNSTKYDRDGAKFFSEFIKVQLAFETLG